MDQQQQEQQAAMDRQQQMMMMQQAPQLLKAPIADPSKNPNAEEAIASVMGGGSDAQQPQ
jgi:hypothetical protein